MRACLVFKSSLCGLAVMLAAALPAAAQVSDVDTRPSASESHEPPTGEDIITIPGPETLDAKRSDPVPKIDKRRKAASRKKPKELRPPKDIPKATPKPFTARSEYSLRASAKRKKTKKSKKGKNNE